MRCWKFRALFDIEKFMLSHGEYVRVSNTVPLVQLFSFTYTIYELFLYLPVYLALPECVFFHFSSSFLHIFNKFEYVFMLRIRNE